MHRRSRSWLGGLALAFVTCGGDAVGPDPQRPPHVLLVVLDTVRADYSSSYGHPQETTPRLDALAELGVVFEDVTAPASWTWPSHASLFTGEPPWVHGAHLVAASEGNAGAHARFGMAVGSLRPDLPTLAERFAAQGYRTVALVVNDWLHPDLGLLRGFETAELLANDARLIEATARELARPDDRPLFLFVNVMTAHSPYRDGPGPWALADRRFLDPLQGPDWLRPYLTSDLPRGVQLSRVAAPHETTGVVRFAAGQLAIPAADMAQLRQLYAAGVRGADFVLGRVLTHWIAASPDGVVAVTSDHGESFGEHGALDHRVSLYPEVLRVPLVVAAPGRLPRGVRVREAVSLQNLHPTLLELAGIEPSAGGSLVGLVEHEPLATPIVAGAWPDPVWAAHAGSRFGHEWRLFRQGDWALLLPVGDPAGAELYHLATDPGMHDDRAARETERVAELVLAAGAPLGLLTREPASAPLAIPDAVADQLRQLGYSH
jgi:arylsulfatase A-like enzyme